MTKKSKNILLGLTGSIAAYKACDVINGLRRLGHKVSVVLTREAHEFVTPLTLQTLSGNKVYSDMFEPVQDFNPLHTSLARAADVILIAPACANTIAKLACGICDDLLTCTVYASGAKVLIAPAMNDVMYSHRVVQENLAKLKSLGYHIIPPVHGRLTCGYSAIGHLADTETILSAVKKYSA